MPARKRIRKRILVTVYSVVAAVLLVITLLQLSPQIVTIAALSDARTLCAELANDRSMAGEVPFQEFRLFGMSPMQAAWNARIESLAKKYGGLFRSGYFDHEYVLRNVPIEGFTPDALAFLLVTAAYHEAIEERLEQSSVDGKLSHAQLEEIETWTSLVLQSTRAKEFLVHFLLRDHELLPGRHGSGSVWKFLMLALLTLRDSDNYGWNQDLDEAAQKIREQVLPMIGQDLWNATLRHSFHETSAVRAGSLLLLLHHPKKEVASTRAREALEDSSELVRLAAGTLLAHHRDSRGEKPLMDGLEHHRWELRWWCGKMLTYLGESHHRDAIEQQKGRETDGFVKREFGKMRSAFELAAE